MHNVFVLKTNSDSKDFEKKLNNFLSKYCRDTDSQAAVYELNEAAKERVSRAIEK